jgi:hypothetical protein
MKDKPADPRATKRGAKRKPYAKPALQTYGAIRVITQDIGSMGNNDGGGNPKTKSM